jgi:type I restriction enzyme R subunit
MVGQQQAKLYADCLEKQFGQRPVIFCSSGYEHWIWDDTRYPPRQVQGFYTKDELELAIQRRDTLRKPSRAAINTAIVERYYQTRAIRHIAEAFERDNERKALLVPDATTVNLVTEREAEGRVYVSTYPTMMGLIDSARQQSGDGRRRVSSCAPWWASTEKPRRAPWPASYPARRSRPTRSSS